MIFPGMDSCLEKIFAPVTIGGIDINDKEKIKFKRDVFKQALPTFKGTFRSNIFEKEYAFLYELLTTLKMPIFDEVLLSTIIDNNSDKILLSPYVDLESILNEEGSKDNLLSDGEKINVFRHRFNDLTVKLSNMEVLLDEFKTACEVYVLNYREDIAFDLVQDMAGIMSPTGKEFKERGKTKVYKGSADMQTYYNIKSKNLREYQEQDSVSHVVLNENWLTNELEQSSNRRDDKTITIGIAEIDDIMGYIRRSNMVGVLGPAKGGKTRFSAYLASRFLENGFNVTVWPLEGTVDEWISMITANMIRTRNGISVSSSDILQLNYDTGLGQVVIATKTYLAMGENRGKLSFIKGVAYVEDFLSVIDSHYENENAFDCIIIDSMVHLTSRDRTLKPERISEGYEQLKNYLSNMMKVPAVAVLTSQLKQTVIDALRKNPEDTIDITAGGESAATIRSPDYVIGLFSSKQERNANIMRMYDVATRHNASFQDFNCHCELGCCYFESDPGLNE